MNFVTFVCKSVGNRSVVVHPVRLLSRDTNRQFHLSIRLSVRHMPVLRANG